MSDKLKALRVEDEKVILSRQQQTEPKVVIKGGSGMAIVPLKYVEEVDEGIVR